MLSKFYYFIVFTSLFLSYSSCVYFRRLFFLFSTEIEETIQFTKKDYGTLILVSTFTYALGKLILGSLNDKIKPERLLALSVFLVSLTVLALSKATTFTELILWVSVNMFLQGGAWIAAIKLVKVNFSSDNFSTLFCIMGCTNNFAGFVAPWTLRRPWRDAVQLYGTIGVGFAAYLALSLSSTIPGTPHESKKKPEKSKPKSLLIFLLTDRTIWIVSMFILIAVEIRTIAESWTPIFIRDTSKNPDFDLKTFLTAFDVGGIFGGLLSGLIVQMLYKKYGRDQSRIIVGLNCCVLLIVSTAMLFCTGMTTFFGFAVGALVYGNINVWGIVSTDMAPREITGTANAVISFICNGGSLIAGRPVALLVEAFGFAGLLPFFLAHFIVPILLYYPCRSSALKVKAE
ncbi:unnamed protein product [Bursaphelenchus okinawaensis]|uniref:Major facilitator superfamily (MFS) profile domain-containing protein n=1 Tax=Bursaphelenchus okinawaensis TaxID=465554 RepID=A0A811L098_9BILA|nr:unnamed protein product [Bursaphelenchus okinawaensis]CAG9113866.1 unnamed protein product [Bursaphelenchus okinawaensis]